MQPGSHSVSCESEGGREGGKGGWKERGGGGRGRSRGRVKEGRREYSKKEGWECSRGWMKGDDVAILNLLIVLN